MGIRISKDHLHPSVIESITSLIGDLNQLETTAKGNAVEAINELLANGGNKEELEALIAEIAEGKELIANAVGEPLTAEESFEEMSSDINSLLSTFKTNMMNNGVTVESSDRFKSLIDKIATMVEEGSGKGIQFASGTCGVSTGQYIKVTDLGFTPSIIIVSRVFTNPLTNTAGHFSLYCPLVTGNPNKYIVGQTTSDSLGAEEPMNLDGSDMSKSYISGDSFQIGTLSSSTSYQYNWVAIGVGEEDTTLRDSLASILEEEGVSVTEEDDMSSLISKVDELLANKEQKLLPNLSGYSPTYVLNEKIGVSSYNTSTNKVLLKSFTIDHTRLNSDKYRCTIQLYGTNPSESKTAYTGINIVRDGEVIYTSTLFGFYYTLVNNNIGSKLVATITENIKHGDIINVYGRGDAPAGTVDSIIILYYLV